MSPDTRLIPCRYCKKKYQECLFFTVGKKIMCNRCYAWYRKGKKHVDGHWVGEKKKRIDTKKKNTHLFGALTLQQRLKIEEYLLK